MTMEAQQLSAIARTAADLASRGSIDGMLHELAQSICELDEIAAVQVVLAEPPDRAMRIMGAAGFEYQQDFSVLLEECRRRGASLVSFDAADHEGQRILHDRRRAMLRSEEWLPLHDYIRQVEWCDYVATSIPLRTDRGGVVNCYLTPGAVATPALLGFLRTMADQAALAIDYHALIERDRVRVRRDERHRIARDIHDSVIQKLFAMSLQARALESAGDETVRAIAREFGEISHEVQSELRQIVRALRPAATHAIGLTGSLRSLTNSVKRDGPAVSLALAGDIDALPEDAADDLYFIVAEAVHNAIKHANASVVSIDLSADVQRVTLVVTDDGTGFDEASVQHGSGLTSLHERVDRWNGRLRISTGATWSTGAGGPGTAVAAEFARAELDGPIWGTG